MTTRVLERRRKADEAAAAAAAAGPVSAGPTEELD
jgi:hypothetical protein